MMTEETPDGAFDRLLQAFLHHDQPALEGLAREGIRVDLRNARGHTVLLCAAAMGEAAAVEWILQAGAEVDASSSPGTSNRERTAFLLAAKHGHPKTAEILLAAGANPNRVDNLGAGALLLAAEKGHLETVRFLVRSGLELDLEDHRGHTALTLARWAGHGDIVALLQALGAAAGTPSEAPAIDSPTPTTQIANQEWQTSSAPQILWNTPAQRVPSEDSISDHFADQIDDQISDWIEDEVADLGDCEAIPLGGHGSQQLVADKTQGGEFAWYGEI